jgi:hypothetical protein
MPGTGRRNPSGGWKSENNVSARFASSLEIGRGRFAEEVITPDGPQFVCYEADPERYPVQPYVDIAGERVFPRTVDAKLRGALTLPEGVVRYPSIEQVIADAEKLALEVYDPVDDQAMFRFVLRLGVASWVNDLLYPHTGRERYAPIIQIIGLPENGKGRFLTVCRAVFYRPLFLNKTVKVPSLFRSIEPWNGTLLLDEADLERSSESSELVEFLNGRAYGNPILRYSTESDKVRAFQSFGYTILATRRPYSDPGFNSRAIILRAQPAADPSRIPLVPSDEWYFRALEIRCQLLLFRLRVWALIRAGKVTPPSNVELAGLSGRFRVRAAFLPLMALKPVAPGLAEDAYDIAMAIHRRQVVERADSLEGQFLNLAYEALEGGSGWLLTRAADAWQLHRPLSSAGGEELDGAEPYTVSTACEALGVNVPRRRVSQAWRNFGQRIKERGRYGRRSPRSILEIVDPVRLCQVFVQYVPDAASQLARFGLLQQGKPKWANDVQIDGTNGTGGTGEPTGEFATKLVPHVPLVPLPSPPTPPAPHVINNATVRANPPTGLPLTPEVDLSAAFATFGLEPNAAFPGIRFHSLADDPGRVVLVSRERAVELGRPWAVQNRGNPQSGGTTPPGGENG